MHLVYLDDSDTKSKASKWQVMAGVIMKDNVFTMVEYAMSGIREGLIPEDKLEKFEEFHACELYGGYGVFQEIDQEQRFEALRQLLFCLRFGECSVVYGGVNIPVLGQEIYASADPLDISFRICIKGIQQYFDEMIARRTIASIPDGIDSPATLEIVTHSLVDGWLHELAILVADDCDKQVKNSLSKSFRTLRSTPSATIQNKLHHFHDDMYFGDSRYSIGIQLADVCSYFITRHLDGDSQIQEFYELIEPYIVFSETYPLNVAPAKATEPEAKGS